MKKKIFSVLLALVLVLSMSLVTAVPARAQVTLNVYPFGIPDPSFESLPTAGLYTFETAAVAGHTALAEQVSTEFNSGSNSIHLKIDTTASSNVGTWARVVESLPNPIGLGKLSGVNFYAKKVAGELFGPYVIVNVDANADGTRDSVIVSWLAAGTTTITLGGGWQQVTQADLDAGGWHFAEWTALDYQCHSDGPSKCRVAWV